MAFGIVSEGGVAGEPPSSPSAINTRHDFRDEVMNWEGTGKETESTGFEQFLWETHQEAAFAPQICGGLWLAQSRSADPPLQRGSSAGFSVLLSVLPAFSEVLAQAESIPCISGFSGNSGLGLNLLSLYQVSPTNRSPGFLGQRAREGIGPGYKAIQIPQPSPSKE